MTTELLSQINKISNEIKLIQGDEYGEQYYNVAFNLIHNHPENINQYQILIEATHILIDDDYKFKLIMNLKQKIKEQDIIIKDQGNRIIKLEHEVKELKLENQQLKQDNKLFRQDNIQLNTKLNILMRRHYNLIIWQAYKNLEYYIIKSVTNFNDSLMYNIDTNLNNFINNPENTKYIQQIKEMQIKFKINNYNNILGKLTKNRIKEAHPDPVELEDLQTACDEMKNVYPGIEELYNNYTEVYNFFTN
jgi:hypothetical protein